MALHAHATVAATQAALNGLFPALPGPVPVPDFVGVFDIGTGNLHAVFDTDGRPFIYSDLGGGALGSAFTFPGHLRLCTSRPPLILLSHFDQDHWRSAVAAGVGIGAAAIGIGAAAIHPQAALCPWLVPTQPRAGVQTAFFNSLVAAVAHVHQRPGHTHGTHLTIGGRVTIFRCTGAGSNHSGLALVLHAAAGAAGRMLLPGDAHFAHIPHGAGGNIDAIIATHHGADPLAVPAAAAVAGNPVAYSYGWGNAYGFPRLAAGVAYVGANYPDGRRMDTAGAEGAADISGPRGNVALCWPGAAGAGARPAAGAPAAAVQGAALAVLAAAAAAVQAAVGAGLPAAVAGQIASAAAWQAMALLHVPLLGPPTPTADLFLGVPGLLGPVAPPPLVPALAAPAAWLATADGQKMAATDILLGAGMPATVARIAQVLRVAHEALAPAVSFDAWNAWGGGGSIQTASSPARAAAYQAMRLAGNGGVAAIAAVTALLVPLPLNVLDTGLLALAPRAISKAARFAHSMPGTNSRRAPQVAEAVATHLLPLAAPLTAVEMAALAAGAAMQPGIATNPEAPNAMAALAAPEIVRVENAMKTAIAAAIVGATAGGAAALVAKAAVAGAMAALGAAAGAPQPSCHRHPSQCGANVCELTLHYRP